MPGTPQRVDDFTLTCAADTSVIAEARRGFDGWLRRWVTDAETVDEMILVLSELLANAVSAAGGEGATVQVLACAEDGAVVLSVRNPKVRWVDGAERWDLDDPLRVGGRGLLIVRSLVDELEVEHDDRDGSTTVRALRQVPAAS